MFWLCFFACCSAVIIPFLSSKTLFAIAHHFQRTFHEKVIGSFPTFPQSMMEALEQRMGGIELKGADAVQRTLSCFTYIAFMIKHYNYYEESQQKPN
jgi:hypothetical protein